MGPRSRQQGGVMGQNILLPGPGELEKLQGMYGNSRVVSHKSSRLMPLVNKILDALQMLTEHVVPKQAPG